MLRIVKGAKFAHVNKQILIIMKHPKKTVQVSAMLSDKRTPKNVIVTLTTLEPENVKERFSVSITNEILRETNVIKNLSIEDLELILALAKKTQILANGGDISEL